MECKKRANNFTSKEEDILINLVKKRKEKIECKRTDTNTNKIKALAWNNLAAEFNAICGETFRDVKILKNKYENLKRRSKKKFADEKLYIFGTGGGPSQEFTFSESDNNMKEILGSQMTGLESEFDADAEDIGVVEDISISIDMQPTVENDLINNEAVTSASSCQVDWSKCTPDMLKTPKSVPLRGVRSTINDIKEKVGITPTDLKSKIGRWAQSKVESTEMSKQCFLEKHNLEMQHIKEKHEQYLQIQERESSQRMKMAEEEHALKMKKLRES